MKPEIEAKFLNVDHDELRAKLEKLSAVRRQPMRLMKRKNYDFPDGHLDKERNGWVRVRDEADKITLSYKQLNNRKLDGTHEVNLTVDSFESACAFLEQIGLKAKTFQESKRESWQLDGTEIELDEWPWAKPYMEIEATDEQALRQVVSKLGLDWQDAVHGSVEIVYTTEYDVTEHEVDSWTEITFTPIPDWLEAKRR